MGRPVTAQPFSLLPLLSPITCPVGTDLHPPERRPTLHVELQRGPSGCWGPSLTVVKMPSFALDQEWYKYNSITRLGPNTQERPHGEQISQRPVSPQPDPAWNRTRQHPGWRHWTRQTACNQESWPCWLGVSTAVLHWGMEPTEPSVWKGEGAAGGLCMGQGGRHLPVLRVAV